MVKFNPDTGLENMQPQPFVSHDMGAIKPDVSGAYKGKGLELVPELGKQLEHQKQSSIVQDIYNETDPVQKQYIKGLQQDYAELAKGEGELVPPGGSATGAAGGTANIGPDLVSPSEREATASAANMGYGAGSPISYDLKSTASKAEAIEGAKRSGKISPTQYDMYMMDLQTNIRARHPEEREIIDETFSRITGRTIANKYIQSLTSDINSFVEKQKAEGAGFLAKLENPQTRAALAVLGPNEYAYYANIAAYGTPQMKKAAQAKMDIAINPIIAKHVLNEWNNTQLNNLEKTRKFTQEDNLARFQSEQSAITSQVIAHSATGGEELSLDNIQKFLGAVDSPGYAERSLKLGMELELKAEQEAARLLQEAYKRDESGVPRAAGMDAKALDDYIQKSVDPLRRIAGHLKGGNAPAAMYESLLSTLRRDQDVRNLQENIPELRAPDALKKMGFDLNSDVGLKVVNKILTDRPDIAKEILSTTGGALSPNKAPGPDGKPGPSLKERVEAIGKDSSKVEGITKGFDLAVEVISDKAASPESLKNAVDNFTDPRNNGVWDLFRSGYTDPNTSGWVEGRSDLYAKVFADPRVHSNIINKLGMEAYRQFAGAAKRYLAHEIDQEAFGNLKVMPKPMGLQIGYDGESHTWNAKIDPAVERKLAADEEVEAGWSAWFYKKQLRNINDQLHIINTGQVAMSVFAQHLNSPDDNPDVIAAQILHDQGFDLSGYAMDDTVGVSLANSVATAVNTKKTSGGVVPEDLGDVAPEQTTSEPGEPGSGAQRARELLTGEQHRKK